MQEQTAHAAADALASVGNSGKGGAAAPPPSSLSSCVRERCGLKRAREMGGMICIRERNTPPMQRSEPTSTNAAPHKRIYLTQVSQHAHCVLLVMAMSDKGKTMRLFKNFMNQANLDAALLYAVVDGGPDTHLWTTYPSVLMTRLRVRQGADVNQRIKSESGNPTLRSYAQSQANTYKTGMPSFPGQRESDRETQSVRKKFQKIAGILEKAGAVADPKPKSPVSGNRDWMCVKCGLEIAKMKIANP